MLIVGFITAIILIVVGTIMDKRERAERDVHWDKIMRRYR